MEYLQMRFPAEESLLQIRVPYRREFQQMNKQELLYVIDGLVQNTRNFFWIVSGTFSNTSAPVGLQFHSLELFSWTFFFVN